MTKSESVRPGERIDDLERSGYRIIQSEEGFRFGMDAVLLSDFAGALRGELTVDLGTGTGIIPILMAARTEGEHFVGVEIDPAAADMAARSVRLNRLEERIEIIEADFTAPDERLKALRGKADVVTANPPYVRLGSGLVSPSDALAMARHEIGCTLRDVCVAASALLKEGGRLYMVHRPSRLPEIMTGLCSARLEPKRLRLIYPTIESEAKLVLIEAVKGAGAECRLERPLIVYDESGRYSEEIREIYGY